MGRRKCTPKQLAALRRGREKLAHKRSKKRTNGLFDKILEFNRRTAIKRPPPKYPVMPIYPGLKP